MFCTMLVLHHHLVFHYVFHYDCVAPTVSLSHSVRKHYTHSVSGLCECRDSHTLLITINIGSSKRNNYPERDIR